MTFLRRCLRVLLPVVLIAPLLTVSPAAAATSAFRGVNWADARDNYVDGWVIPTGLTAGDSYDVVRTKADGIITGFQQQLGANTVRLPINPQSVNSDWWARYKGAADSALAHGMKVVFGYWEANKDGFVDDATAWNTMWDKVTADYGGNGNVYFEPMNEPFGYSLNAWVSLCSTWLSRHSAIPRGRVLISGTGYNDNVTGVGAASALSGTLLSLHFYGFWASDTTRAAWTANLSSRLGSYSSRTIIDEAGAPMTTGLDYSAGHQDGNNFTAYFAATTDLARSRQLGVVYWPGLRSGDTYSITRQSGSGLATNNASGVVQLRWGWGL
ncbi:Cellulase (glycosyl hydrolase family 5) [Amycolatopsis pretoriensis]|uniref:Cellulase (Glycosyl hydrolase family 5) n=1 Tax=Amycolatopsis pretoriensis TaxID=218821 RepID=A0A1H5QR04_9PSEU|nr:cellulase family glycosylhydrolase [Amycolatopsis pretoriensis]SEF28582.1 Cellulase (glycosyl hydrolase family 5) [Amycolatopsis pretoriensis]